MNYQIANKQPSSSLLILGFFNDDKAHKHLESYALNEYLKTDLRPQKEATSLVVTGGETPVMLLNLGKKESYSMQSIQKAASNIVSTLKTLSCETIALCLPALSASADETIKQAIIALEYHRYAYNTLKSDKSGTSTLTSCVFLSDANEMALNNGLAIAQGVKLARDLANAPANHLTPTDMAAAAITLAKEQGNITTKVLDEAKMRELGMNTILSVSQGSDEPAQFIEMQYKQGGDKKPIVLIGKGITFDSGGLSLKPPGGMMEMKFDMCGAATVLGVMKAISTLELPLNVIGLIASSENLPGPKATKPGDVIQSYSKQTIEVLNTDAEGRLVLCDALTYAEQFNPAKVIDIATLTGAMIVALGYKTNGIMGNNDALCHALIAAGETIGDRGWQLPLWDEYQELLDSNVADMSNISSDKSAGSITAGCFLARFAKKYHWAHIDCAGTAWVSGKNKNGSGRPVPLLTQFLLNECV